jgi:hypothetical protein
MDYLRVRHDLDDVVAHYVHTAGDPRRPSLDTANFVSFGPDIRIVEITLDDVTGALLGELPGPRGRHRIRGLSPGH